MCVCVCVRACVRTCVCVSHTHACTHAHQRCGQEFQNRVFNGRMNIKQGHSPDARITFKKIINLKRELRLINAISRPEPIMLA